MSEFKDFDEMSRTIKSMSSKWEKASEGADEKQTYAALHSRMVHLHEFLANERDDMNKRLSSMRDTYSEKVVEKQKKKLSKEFDEFSNNLVKACREEIQELTESKREHIAQMITTPPSDDQLRLLQVLQMRTNISDTELQNIAPAFFDNYNALKVLQNIGEKNGVHVALPVQLDARAMFEAVTGANAELLGASEYLSTPNRNVAIQYRAFYSENPEQPDFIQDPKYREYVEAMDGIPQLQDIKATKESLTPMEKVKIQHYYSDIADSVSDLEITKRTAEIMSAHPEDIPLLKVSDYKGYVADVEAAASNAE